MGVCGEWRAENENGDGRECGGAAGNER
jgi:hypothetical protein